MLKSRRLMPVSMVATLLAAMVLYTPPGQAADLVDSTTISNVTKKFDGEYVGTLRLVHASGTGCAEPVATKVYVRQGVLVLPWEAKSHFTLKIVANGSFHDMHATTSAQAEKHMSAPPTATGRITANRLIADYGTRFCHYILEADRA